MDIKKMIEIADKEISLNLINEIKKNNTAPLTTDDIINISNTYTKRMIYTIMQTYHEYIMEKLSKKL